MADQKERLIKLGIALDYPVHWKFEKIIRDLIQNFFDAIGSECFAEDFHYSIEPIADGTYQVSMETAGYPFAHEWLEYIGASTKTESCEVTIGMYGEGFKICMISLLKLGITDVSMHSKDWVLHPCIYSEDVDGKSVDMLGYQLLQVPEDEITSLILKGVPHENLRYLEEALLHFFFPENPLFGEKIAEGDDYIIYTGRGKVVPCQQPLKIQGIFYLNYLARGRLYIPFFVMYSGPMLDDVTSRKREILDEFIVWTTLYQITRKLTPEESLRLLILMSDYWNDLPDTMHDITTYYYVICQLVRNVSSSSETTDQFRQEYDELVYIDRPGSDKRTNSRIRQVKVWAKDQGFGNRMVNPVFRLLGAESLIEKFTMKDKQFSKPTPHQAKMIKLLFSLYETIVPAYLQTNLPQEVLIGTKEEADGDPLVYADKDFWSRKRLPYQKI